MTHENIIIKAEERLPASASALEKQRKNGVIPGILYGKKGTQQISLRVVNLPKEHPRAKVVKLELNNSQKSVLMREVQVNPLSGKPIHMDFQEVAESDVVRVHVPLEFVGLTREQEKEGSFKTLMRYLEVKSPVKTLPASIKIDVSQLKVDQSVHLKEIALPQGVVVKTGKGRDVALASLVRS